MYDLRSRLNDRGSDLLIRFGKPEKVVANLVAALQARGDHVEGVWLQKEITAGEIHVEEQVRKAVEPKGVPVRFVHGKTLIHPADLPFEVVDTPDVFTPFRKRVESLGSRMVRTTFKPPNRFKPFLPDLPTTDDYSLDVTYEVDVDGLDTSKRSKEPKEQEQGQVSFHDILRYLLLPLSESQPVPPLQGRDLLQQRHPASAFPLRGGESSALERLEWYFVRGKSADSSRWDRDDPPPVARYKQTRNNLVGHAYSTKMSPFLAYGSVSPRQIWEALDYHERKFGENQNTYWVRFELLWRDYFFFVAEKFGDLLFELGGFEMETDPEQAKKKMEAGWWRGWDPDRDGPEHEVTRLLEGRTGIPFIDANIIELRESGFMSNRGRQNVASFLSKDLGCDWRIGAEFFQSHLIDYDPTSNYGNWQYVAGVGNDPRASRQFNTIKQAKDYDSHGEYVKLWIPALRNLDPDYVHTPWLLPEDERRRYGLKTTAMDVTLAGYPAKPMVELDSWQKHYERREGVGSKMRGNPQEKVKDAKLRRLKQRHAGLRASGGNGGGSGSGSPSGSNAGHHSYRAPHTQGGGNSIYPDAHSYDFLASSSGHGTAPASNDVHRNILPPLRGSGPGGLSNNNNNSRLGQPERKGSPFGASSRSSSAHGGFTGGILPPQGLSSSGGNSNSNNNGRADADSSNWRRGPGTTPY